ncbi:hypothetical protein EON65_27795 [archaeon]|nr:MAG: hypothetical protein EON65_27795 [archaeon]
MGNQHNEMRSQAVTGFSMIFTIIATFGMAYYLSQKMGFHEPQVSQVQMQIYIFLNYDTTFLSLV